MILISLNAFIAQNTVEDIQSGMNDSYDYHLIFRNDGKTTHYDVTRYDSSEIGEITLTYYTSSNQLDISKVSNIKELEIDVNSMFKDESLKVFKRPYDSISNMDMLYWLEAGEGIFTVTFDIDDNEPMEKLTFTEFPEPTSVLVNNRDWWKTGLNYSIDKEEITITNIPTGETTVIFDFNIPNQIPVPIFMMNPDKKAGVNQEIAFNASISYDPDGEIIHWLWDFGDESADSGPVVAYQYSKPGTYTVKLTVRDDSEPYAEASLEKNITIEYGAEQDNDNDGKGDKLPDWWEWEHFENLNYGPNDDPDTDGYSNGLEYLADTDPMDNTDFSEDSDDDGLPDNWEWDYFRSLEEVPTGDPDNDRATNLEEFKANTNPLDDKSKPEESEGDEDEKGIFQMDPQMDLIIILIIIVIIVVIVIFMVIGKGKKKKKAEPVISGAPSSQQPYTPESPQQQPLQPPTQQYEPEQQQPEPQPLPQPQPQPQPSEPVQPPMQTPSQPSAQPELIQESPTSGFTQTTTSTTPITPTTSTTPTTPTTPGTIQSKQQTQLSEPLPVKGPPETKKQSISQEPIMEMSNTSSQEIETEPDFIPEPVQDLEPVVSEDPINPDTMAMPLSTSTDSVDSIEPSGIQSQETPPTVTGANTGTDTDKQEVINQYIRLMGIDLDTASRVYNAGYVQLDYLILAAVDELAAIEGVGQVTAVNIKEKIDNMEKVPGPQNEQGNTIESESLDIPGEELLDRLNNLKNRINNLEENNSNKTDGSD
jgi:PKD repeat protein